MKSARLAIKCFFAVIISVVAIIGCDRNDKRSEILSAEQEKVAAMCFGRNKITVPDDFFIGKGMSGVFGVPNKLDSNEPWEIELQLESAGLTEFDFHNRISARKAYLDRVTSGNIDKVTESRSVGPSSHIIHVNNINQAYTSELHALIGGVYLTASVESYHDQFREAEAQLIFFIKNITEKAAPADGDSTGGRYCFGALTINGMFNKEHVALLLRSKRRPDITINLTSDTYIPDARKTLLQRVDEGKSLLVTLNSDSKVIREGTLQVASMEAQEWLGWMMLGDGEDRHKQYGFKLQTRRPDPSPAKPQISIELVAGAPEEGGTPRPLSLDEAHLIHLWDNMIRSIR